MSRRLGITQSMITSTGNNMGKKENWVIVNRGYPVEVFAGVAMYNASVPPQSLKRRVKHSDRTLRSGCIHQLNIKVDIN